VVQSFDVLVRGAGAVGQALALTLGRLGLAVALRDEVPAARAGDDVRAFALNAASMALLRDLRVWEALPAQAVTSVHQMQVRGDAPAAQLEFSAWQQRVGALAWIVDAQALERELQAALRFAPHVTRVDADVSATLTALCEGKASATRAAMGVEVERIDYGQQAIAARLNTPRDHQNVAHQWFRSPDVLALLPLDAPQHHASYALVWSCPDERARQLLALEPGAFEAQLALATGGEVGGLTLCSPRAAWPLTLAQARPWCGPGWVLLGDAAHVVHPLAGQGLNLGFADVAALGRVIAARESWRRLDDPRLLRRYVRERQSPTWAMGRVTDGLLQLFARPEPAARELRNRGMTLLNHLPPLKRWLNARAIDS
jgi:2-polyprenyl-6-methoxyphenol hydroxylase-like FAD-dependent oxidoreductase